MRPGGSPAVSSCGPALLSREARVSPTAVPQRSEAGAWLARYGELQNSLFLTLARPLGMAGAGGRDAFGDLFQIAATAAWVRERDGEPIRNPRAFLRQVIINQRKMQLRSERRHPATSYDEIVTSADGNGGSGIDAMAGGTDARRGRRGARDHAPPVRAAARACEHRHQPQAPGVPRRRLVF